MSHTEAAGIAEAKAAYAAGKRAKAEGKT